MTQIHPPYRWLLDETAPRILIEAIKLYGTIEAENEENNPIILSWAREIGGYAKDNYSQDSIPWCGLYVGVCAHRAGWDVPHNPLWAFSWSNWGRPVPEPMLGDILVFSRDGGGHVGFYVGEDHEAYHVLGGNQSDAVTFCRILKTRLKATRRCPWRIAQPLSVRRIFLQPTGGLSKNES